MSKDASRRPDKDAGLDSTDKKREPRKKHGTRKERLAPVPKIEDPEQRQRNWEDAEFRRAKELLCVSGAAARRLSAGRRLLRSVLISLERRIAHCQLDEETKIGCNGRPSSWHHSILQLNSQSLAAITAIVALQSCSPRPRTDDADKLSPQSVATLAREIAAAAELMVKQYGSHKNQREATETGDSPAKDIQRPLRVSNRSWFAWKQKYGDMKDRPWPETVGIELGTKLLDLLAEDERFNIINEDIGGDDSFDTKTTKILTLSGDIIKQISNPNVRIDAVRPALLPMVTRPKDWRYNTTGGFEGGYLNLRSKLIRFNPHEHAANTDRAVSDLDLNALNIIQSTAWRVNRAVLDVLTKAWEAQLPLLHAPENVKAIRMPKRLTPEAWAAADENIQKRHKEERRRVHLNRKAKRRRDTWKQGLLDKLAVANLIRDEPRIYYPHNRDFRMRIYPIPMIGPHPQSDDLGKALIEFANGVRLGKSGLRWLCIRAANCAGHDKIPFKERVDWAQANKPQILAAAEDPIANAWWADADEPWSLLATCFELAAAWTSSDPDVFESHLPIPLDATCSGLQHLSALALDPILAEKVNLAGGDRQDIYQEVADRVSKEVELRAAEGNELAQQWRGKVTRAVVKRPVMTTPYGVTKKGIQAQVRELVTAGSVVLIPEVENSAVEYFAGLIDRVRSSVMPSAMTTMRWLRKVAVRLGRENLDFQWKTPTESICNQAYLALDKKRISTPVGTLTLSVPKKPPRLDLRKQRSSAAPNFVHSLDAAHLSKTVVAAASQGVDSFAMIHDSFGTHAGRTDNLGRALREQFVEIYKPDVLARIHLEIGHRAGISIPAPPKRGNFNIGQVIDSEFFFS